MGIVAVIGEGLGDSSYLVALGGGTALVDGPRTDTSSVTAAVWAVAALTGLSGLVVLVRTYETQHPVLDTIDPALRANALEEVKATLADHQTADGVQLACGIHLIHARN